MIITAKMIAYRNLRYAREYYTCVEHVKLTKRYEMPDLYKKLVPLTKNEQYVGYYLNNKLAEEGNLIITNKGIYIIQQGDKAEFLPFIEMDWATMLKFNSPEEKASADRVIIAMCSGEDKILFVKGHKGKLRDAFSMLGFLRNIIRNLNNNKYFEK